MAKCKYDKCDKDVTGRQVYCSDKCRKAQSRTDKSDTTNNSDIKSDKPSVIPERLKTMLDTDIIMAIKAKPKAIDPAVQAIWDKRNAQGQAAGYSEQATAEDYPQTQRPHRKPEPGPSDWYAMAKDTLKHRYRGQ